MFSSNNEIWVLAAIAFVCIGAIFYFGTRYERRDKLSAEAFTEQFTSRIARAHPNGEVSVKSALQVEVDKLQINLGNAYQDYLSGDAGLEQVLDNFVSSTVRILHSRTAPRLTPHQSILAVLRDAASFTEPQEVKQQFSKTMSILYVEDQAGMMAYLVQNDLTRLGLDMSRLKELAKVNLSRFVPREPMWTREAGYAVLTDEDNAYLSSLALIDDYWSEGRFGFKGSLVLYIPNRHTLIVTGTREPDGIRGASAAATIMNLRSSRPISTEPLVRQDGQWKPALD